MNQAAQGALFQLLFAELRLRENARGVRSWQMREILWFFASLAGAAILTALAVIVSPQSLFWRAVLFGGIYLLLICAVLISLDMRKPLKERSKMVPLIGMVVFGLGFIGCTIWYIWPQNFSQSASPRPAPENDELRTPLSMRQLFDSDFAGLAKIAMQSEVQERNDNYVFAYAQYFELPTNSFFLARRLRQATARPLHSTCSF